MAILDGHDALFLDLDGVVYEGPHPIPHAVDTINDIAASGLPVAYITNNASRSPEQVAEHLSSFGIATDASHIFGSAATAAEMLKIQVQPGDPVLVVGSRYLADEVRRHGYRPLNTQDAETQTPRAVIQGFDPSVGWKDLAAASFAILGGASWFATNTDKTIPQPQGIAPGNGALVAAVEMATGMVPLVAGKPEPVIFHLAAQELGVKNPLMVGDRLDTDILGGNNAGFDTALVLTGIHGQGAVDQADADMKPTYIINDLRELLTDGRPHLRAVK